MKTKIKNIFKVILMTMIVLSIFVLANADHIYADDEHYHDQLNFSPWESNDSLPDRKGDFYLTQDVTLSSTWNTPNVRVNLCLNGHRITNESGDDLIVVQRNGVLNIYDEEGGGSITGHGVDSKSSAIVVKNGGSLNFIGGTISNWATAINIDNGTMTIYGGTMKDNEYGVYANSASDITIRNGTISGNIAISLSGSDNKLTINDGTFTGSASDNPASLEIAGTSKNNVIVNGGTFNSPVKVSDDADDTNTMTFKKGTINAGAVLGDATVNFGDPDQANQDVFDNEFYIKGGANGKNITVYAGYYDQNTYGSVKDKLTAGRKFTDSDISDYLMMVGDAETHSFSFNILPVKTDWGSISTNVSNARVGEQITITVNPSENHSLDKLTVQSSSNRTNIEVTQDPNNINSYTFIMPDDRVVITAFFVEAPGLSFDLLNCELVSSDTDLNNILPETTVRFRLKGRDGYDLAYVLADGAELSRTDGSYSFKMPKNNVKITAAYLKKTEEHVFNGEVKDAFYWERETGLPAVSGTYVLSRDITILENRSIDYDMDLCLDGHTITTRSSNLDVINGRTLNLYDETGEGRIIPGNGGTSIGVRVSDNSTFNMFGGTIEGYSTAIKTAPYGSVNIYRGDISGDLSIDLSDYSNLRIGNEASVSDDIHVGGRITNHNGTGIIVYAGYFDQDAYKCLSLHGENALVSDGKMFTDSDQGSYDKMIVRNKYFVKIDPSNDGLIEASKYEAKPNSTIQLTVHPDEYNRAGSIEVINNKDGEMIALDDDNSFVMPAADVTVKASFTNTYTIRFLNDDGTVLQEESLGYDALPEYAGEEPMKDADEEYTYQFSGWTPAIMNVSSDMDYVAEYEALPITIKYTITWRWKDTEGNNQTSTTEVEEGSVPVFPDGMPQAPEDEVFAGWDAEISEAAGNTVYTAVYADPGEDPCTILFIDDNGQVLQELSDVAVGTLPEYTKDTPGKASDAQYDYIFSGWIPEIVPAEGFAIYKAVYTETARQYEVTWKNDDGTILNSSEFEYGQTPVYSDPVPAREDISGTYEYTFDHWDPYPAAVRDDQVYTAVFKKIARKCSVTIDPNDGSEEKMIYVSYGTAVPRPDSPEKEGYIFAGWYLSDDTKWDFGKEVKGEVRLTARWYEDSYLSFMNNALVRIARNDLQGKKGVSNRYNDYPLLILAQNGVIVLPANLKDPADIPQLDKENQFFSFNVDFARSLKFDIKDKMYGIYLDVNQTKTIDDNIAKEDNKVNYVEIADSGFIAEIRQIYGKNETNYDYPLPVTLTLYLDQMDISLPEAPAGVVRSFYVGHNYKKKEVEYLTPTISSDRNKLSFTVTALSPFDIVYKDVKRPTPSGDYIPPKPGD